MSDLAISRRLTLGLIGVALINEACNPLGSDTDRSATAVPTKTAAEFPTQVVVPSVHGTELLDVSKMQRPPIGLLRVDIFSSEKYPLTAVFNIWGSDTPVQPTNGKIFRHLKMGYQRYSSPFIPDETQLIEPQQLSDQDPDRDNFAASIFQTIEKNPPPNIPGMKLNLVILPKPEVGQRYVLVYGQGIVDYKGEPSALSYIEKQLEFVLHG